MRLTLRTLLAYLDDRLPSANAREIGRKLSESPFAQDLADRIRTVVRQRRLSRPGRKIKMIDPNLIAEYLDDQLTPELVSLIEKEVLSSDFSLAEVAASHEILGLLGDPVEIEDRVRARLLALNPDRKEGDTTDHEVDQIKDKPITDADQEVWQPLERQRGFSPRSPALVLAVLSAGLIALFIADRRSGEWHWDNPGPGPGQPVADASSSDKPASPPVEASDSESEEAAEVADSPPTADNSENEEPAVAAMGDSDATESPAEPSEDGDREEEIAEPTEDPSEEMAAADPATSSPVPGPKDESASSTPEDPSEVPGPEVDGAEEELPPVPAVARRFRLSIEDPHQALLTRPTASADWGLLAKQQGDNPNAHDLLTQNITAVAVPFAADITPVDTGWTAAVLSPSLLSWGDGVLPRLSLYDGRCVVTRNELNGPLRQAGIDLSLGDGFVRCLLSGDDVQLGLLVEPVPVVTDDGETAANGTTNDEYLPLQPQHLLASLFVAGGTVTVTELGEQPDITLTRGRVLRMAVQDGAISETQLDDSAQLDTIPRWVYTGSETGVEEVENVKRQLSRLLAADESVPAAALSASQHRNPLLAGYASAVLAVTRDVDGLVQVLLESKDERPRLAAIEGLRTVAAQTASGRAAVLKALEIRLPYQDHVTVVRLLEGIPTAEAGDPEASTWLIRQLDHDRVAVRQLAILEVERLTGETKGYHPDSDKGRRNDLIRRWNRHLKRHQGQLLQDPAAPGR